MNRMTQGENETAVQEGLPAHACPAGSLDEYDQTKLLPMEHQIGGILMQVLEVAVELFLMLGRHGHCGDAQRVEGGP